MNPSFTDAPQAAESEGGATDRPEPAADRPVATAEDEAAERVAGEPPAPVHVPYARTDAELDVVSAPVRGGPRRPARSPFWAAVRSHVWLGVIVIVLVGGAATAYWGLRVHQRIGETTLEHGVQGREGARTVRCVEQQPNGAVWACGLVYNAESVCLIANVNPAGDWTTKPGVDLCANRPELTALLPPTITPGAVEADLQAHGTNVSKCAKIPTTKVRWACLVPGASSTSCVFLRVVPWGLWTTAPSPVCSHLPALEKFLKKGT
ncbi:MAG: hypothetical protein ACRDQE_05220 [Gaiellales bacterium]